MSNYIQPGTPSTSGVSGTETAFRSVSVAVTVIPHQPGAVSGNPLNLTWPVARFIEPGLSAKDDPSGVLRR